jgi:hypothetical protein
MTPEEFEIISNAAWQEIGINGMPSSFQVTVYKGIAQPYWIILVMYYKLRDDPGIYTGTLTRIGAYPEFKKLTPQLAQIVFEHASRQKIIALELEKK